MLCQYVQGLCVLSHPRQMSLKSAVLNQCWLLFPCPCLETSGMSCGLQTISHQVPKSICSLKADLISAQKAGFLHILLMERSVLLRGIQKISRYFLFWKTTPGQGGAGDECFFVFCFFVTDLDGNSFPPPLFLSMAYKCNCSSISQASWGWNLIQFCFISQFPLFLLIVL